MSRDLKKLYPEIIKTHQASPFHFEKRSDAAITLKAYNPICGDRFDFFLDFDSTNQNPIICQLSFHGFGCAISKSSASIMVKSMIGKTPDEALKLCSEFLGFINNELTGNDLLLRDEFVAFSGVREFPDRLECAALAWREMQKFLKGKK